MRNKIQFDGVKFWVDQNIIYCKFSSSYNKNYKKIDIEEIFYNGISIVSNGRYMPILIDLKVVNYSDTIKIFKYLHCNQMIRSLILSQVFLVKSINLKLVLLFYNLNKKPFFYNKICTDANVAIKFCNKDNMVFNPISFQQ